MAVIQTDPKEAREFIMQNYGMAGVVGFILLWLIILYVFYKFNFVEKIAFGSAAQDFSCLLGDFRGYGLVLPPYF
jgi:hypothetical protein